MKAQKKRKPKLSVAEREEKKIKNTQESEIRTIFKNIGFNRIPNIDGKQIIYDGRQSEMDDIFIYENIILITEYTIMKNPGDHLKNKTLFYNKITEKKEDFINFLINEPRLSSFKNYYEERMALLHKHSKAEFSPIHSNLRHNLGARST